MEDLCNISCVLELSQVNIGSALLDSITYQLCRTSLTLGSDDGSLFLLAGLVDNESSTLGLLLGNLFGFDSSSELRGKGEVLGDELLEYDESGQEYTYCKRNIIQHDIKSRRSSDQIIPDKPTNVLTLGDQLTCVELCHHTLQHLVYDRG